MGTCAAREALGTETLRLAACAVEMLRGGGRAEERTGSERVIRCVGTAIVACRKFGRFLVYL